MEKEREGFIFYRSFYKALSLMNDQIAGKCIKDLANYALNGIVPNIKDKTESMFFALTKEQIDANTRRYENGCKGGRPKKATAETNDDAVTGTIQSCVDVALQNSLLRERAESAGVDFESSVREFASYLETIGIRVLTPSNFASRYLGNISKRCNTSVLPAKKVELTSGMIEEAIQMFPGIEGNAKKLLTDKVLPRLCDTCSDPIGELKQLMTKTTLVSEIWQKIKG